MIKIPFGSCCPFHCGDFRGWPLCLLQLFSGQCWKIHKKDWYWWFIYWWDLKLMGIFKDILLMVDFLGNLWATNIGTILPSMAIQGRDIPPKTRPFASHGVWRTPKKIINHCYLRAQRFFFPEVYWLVVLTILKNIGQWEGLSHILWKKHVWNHQPV